MFSWLARCWGGIGVINQFERARISCTYPDWGTPSYMEINFLMKTFRSENNQMSSQAAINSLFSHFEEDDEKQNPAFILKNLLILDLITEQRIFLSKINQYYNGRLMYMESNKLQISSSIKQLIASYYIYVKQKAKLYMDQQLVLIEQKTRKQFIHSMPPNRVLAEINICFKIQNLILAISDNFLNGNKSPPLIQQIFSMLLKTYIFCYSIVALAVQSFTKKLTALRRTELEHFYKLAKFFNKQYTRNFLLFIQRNKIIENFKKIKYNEMIIINDRILESINNQLIILNEQSYADPLLSSVKELPFQIQTKIQIETKSEYEQEQKQTEIGKKWRIPLKITDDKQPNKWVDSSLETNFQTYNNFYSDKFITDSSQFVEGDEQSQKIDLNLKDTAILYSKISQPTLKKQYSTESSSKFSKDKWETWINLYAF